MPMFGQDMTIGFKLTSFLKLNKEKAPQVGFVSEMSHNKSSSSWCRFRDELTQKIVQLTSLLKLTETSSPQTYVVSEINQN